RELEERGAGVEELLDAFANGQLPLAAVPLKVLLAAAEFHARVTVAQLGNQRGHALVILAEPGARRVHVRIAPLHPARAGRGPDDDGRAQFTEESAPLVAKADEEGPTDSGIRGL